MPQKVIESITKTKNKGIYIISFSNQEYKITDDLIVKYALTKGKSLDDETYALLVSDINIEIFYIKVCKYIAYRFRSEYEIRTYLEKLNASIEIIDKIIIKLKSVSLIDDELLARVLLNSSINNLKGSKYFQRKLFNLHIKTDLIYELSDELDTLDKALSKIIYKYEKYPINKQKALIINKLLNQGFSENIVIAKVNKLELINNSSESLLKDYERLERRYSSYDENIRKNKIISSLLRKGYSFDDIKKVYK